MSDEIGIVVVGGAHPTGTIIDIPSSIPDPTEHPKFKGDSRVHGLFETPYQPPAARET